MNLYEKIKNREEKISLVGLGYVGMPIAVAFAKKVDVIGFDVNKEKIELYKQGIDPTKEVGQRIAALKPAAQTIGTNLQGYCSRSSSAAARRPALLIFQTQPRMGSRRRSTSPSA